VLKYETMNVSPKTSDDILLFLVKNSKPEYHEYPVEGKPLQQGDRPLTKDQKLYDLLLSVSGTTRYLCPLDQFEDFLGEEYSFEKHLRPLYESGTLYFAGIPSNGDFYDSKEYRKAFSASTGIVCSDYKNKTRWVAFHYRENEFLSNMDKLVENALKLGVLKNPKRWK